MTALAQSAGTQARCLVRSLPRQWLWFWAKANGRCWGAHQEQLPVRHTGCFFCRVTVPRFSGQVVVIRLSGDKTDFAFCNLVLFPQYDQLMSTEENECWSSRLWQDCSDACAAIRACRWALRATSAGVFSWLCRFCLIFDQSIEPSVVSAAVGCSSSGSVRANNPCLSPAGLMIELRQLPMDTGAGACYSWAAKPLSAGTLAITAEGSLL